MSIPRGAAPAAHSSSTSSSTSASPSATPTTARPLAGARAHQTIAAVAAASLATSLALAACVHTVSGPPASAQPGPGPGPSGAGSPSGGGTGYGGLAYSDAGSVDDGFGGFGYSMYVDDGLGGVEYGGLGYGGLGVAVDLYACRADTECVIYFRSHGCFAGDPLAVAAAQLATARRLIPERFEPCGMGGPDFERRRLAQEGRYRAVCGGQGCALLDRGPQPVPF